MQALPQAAPAPVFGPLRKAGRKGVSFDIATHAMQMPIVLHRKRFETPLIEMSTPNGLFTEVVSLRVGQSEPSDESRQVSILPWPQDKMPVIRHDAVAQNPHVNNRLRLGKHPLEGLVIAMRRENSGLAVRPIQHVINDSSKRFSQRSSHGYTLHY
jgi:hypothetical protein